jgi:hypothetical protein
MKKVSLLEMSENLAANRKVLAWHPFLKILYIVNSIKGNDVHLTSVQTGLSTTCEIDKFEYNFQLVDIDFVFDAILLHKQLEQIDSLYLKYFDAIIKTLVANNQEARNKLLRLNIAARSLIKAHEARKKAQEALAQLLK